MTMTSFPWEKKAASSFPWEKQETSSSISWQNRSQTPHNRWQNPMEEKPSYHWQSAAPTETSTKFGKFPWEITPGQGSNNYFGQTSANPFGQGSTNPFDGTKQSFPWEKTSSTLPQPAAPNDLFVFGKKEPKKPGGGTYSSFYNDQQKTNTDSEKEKGSKPVGGGTYSSFNNEKKALFPWEKQKSVEPTDDSLEAQLANYLQFSIDETNARTSDKDTSREKDFNTSHDEPKRVEDDTAKLKETGKKSPKTKAKTPKSPKAKTKSKSPTKDTGNSEEEKALKQKISPSKQKSLKHDIKVALPDTTEDTDKEETILKEETFKEETNTEQRSVKENSKPITSPASRPISRSSSVTKLATKGKPTRIKSAPAVPRHINKKSEMLARGYLSAYAKPKIPPKKTTEENAESKPRLSYRKEQSMSEWVYPSPPEPVDWKTRSDQGLAPKPPAPDTTTPHTQSEYNMDSTSLREAAFLKWIEKKKENKTFKKCDLVTVISNREDMPSASDIRQENFEEWYRSRAVEVDKKKKQENEEQEKKNKDAAELNEEKKKSEVLSRRLWEEKDQERKLKIKAKRAEEANKLLDKKKEDEEKKKNADKNFKTWKEAKDPKLKEDAKKKKVEVKEKTEKENNDKEMKEIEAQKSYKAWKEAKEQELLDKREKEGLLKKQKQQQELREKREKEAARARAVEQWNAQKEQDKNKITIPQHISPWKNGAAGNVVISRDEQLMANVKHKKNKAKQRPPSRKSQDSETEVEFVN